MLCSFYFGRVSFLELVFGRSGTSTSRTCSEIVVKCMWEGELWEESSYLACFCSGQVSVTVLLFVPDVAGFCDDSLQICVGIILLGALIVWSQSLLFHHVLVG